MTALAILETVAAVGGSLRLVWYHGTVTHIAVSACLAPFALMRSKEATYNCWDFVEMSFKKSSSLYEKRYFIRNCQCADFFPLESRYLYGSACQCNQASIKCVAGDTAQLGVTPRS